MNRLDRRWAKSLRHAVPTAIAASAMLACSLTTHAQTRDFDFSPEANGSATAGRQFSLGFGAGLDRGKTDCVDGYSCDHSSAHGKLFLNYRLDEAWDLQALGFAGSRFKGGDTTDDGTTFGGSFRVDALGLAAGYRVPLAPDWWLRGQLGVAAVRTRFSYAAPFEGDVSKTQAQPLAGLSAGYAIAPGWLLSLDYDFTRFKVHSTRGSLHLLGLSAQMAF